MNYFYFAKEPAAVKTAPAPALFLSHGAPTAILQKDGFYTALESFANSIPKPGAIVVLSAHWLTNGVVSITSAGKNTTIHDFYGFPRELYEMTYPAPGAPDIAEALAEAFDNAGLKSSLNAERGLDHGSWVPLKIMYPDADVPVLQVSLPYPNTPEAVFTMGQILANFREQNIMLIGSGSMTHNLSALNWENENAPPSKASTDFDKATMGFIEANDPAGMFNCQKTLPNWRAMHPTDEHFLPLFFTAGCRMKGDSLVSIYDKIHFSTLSLRSFAFVAK